MKSYLKATLIGLIISSFFLLFFTPSLAHKKESSSLPKDSRKVVIVLVDQITWEDIKEAKAPFIKSLIKKGAIGVMSTRTSGNLTPLKAYATVGAGNTVGVAGEIEGGFNASEPFEGERAKEVFWWRTGVNSPPQAVVYLGLASLEQRTQKLPYNVSPGGLGEVLSKNGLSAAVLGNADTSFLRTKDSYHREAAVIAMDTEGIVKRGDVSKDLLESDPRSPFGLRTNTDLLLERFLEVKDESNLTVIDFGDTSRVGYYAKMARPDVLAKHRRLAIERADSFLEKLFSFLDLEKTLVMVASPLYPTALPSRAQLTPIMVAGDGMKPGLLTSPTTRTKGLVSHIDIAPTTLRFLGVPASPSFVGRKMTSVPFSGDKLSYLNHFNKQTVTNFLFRKPVITFYIIFELAVLLLALAAFLAKEIPRHIVKLALILLLAVVVFPLSFFAFSFLNFYAPNLSLFLVLNGLLTLTLAILLFASSKKRFSPLILICFATGAFLVTDLFFGGNLNTNTIFGYSPLIGARFYGIGNEAMAILISGAIIGSTAFLEQRGTFSKGPKILIPLFFIFLVFVLGFSKLGANTGGTITAVAAFGVTYLQLRKRKIGTKEILTIMGLAVLAVVLLVTVELLGVVNFESHLGRLSELIGKGEFKMVFQLFQRKVLTNLRVMKYSSWSYLLLSLVALLVFLRVRGEGIFKVLFSKYPYLSAGVTGGFTAGIVGFLTNDSGVAISGLIFSYFAATVFYLMLSDKLLGGLLAKKKG